MGYTFTVMYAENSTQNMINKILKFISSSFSSSFYHAKQSAVLPSQVVCPSVRPSVCLSLTLRDRGHTGWNSWKIISRRLISLTFSLSTDPNMTDLLQREQRQILARIGMG